MYAVAWAIDGVGGPGAGGMFTSLMPLILIFVIFYFLLIVPQRRKQRQHRDMVRNLKKGDRIVTTGGIYGTISNVKKNYLEVEITSQIKIRVQRSCVSQLRGEE